MESQKRDALCAALEKEYVHDVYNKTAHHFVDVKYKAWPRVKAFLLEQQPGSLVADIGCGSGKYLSINKGIMTLGCDHSNNLVHVAGQQGHHVLSCDNLSLPFRENCFDAVISIGVIHHFTTPSRRAKAIQELARVLRPGGRVMIYVWAMEQKHRKFKAQDVLVPWHLKTKQRKPGKSKHDQDRRNSTSRELRNPANNPHHTSLTSPNVNVICPYTYNGSIDTPRVNPRSNRTRSAGSHKSNIKTSQRSDGSNSDLTGEYENDKIHQDNKHIVAGSAEVRTPFSIQKKATEEIVSAVKPKMTRDVHVCEDTNSFPKRKDLLKIERRDSLPNIIKAKFLSLIGKDSPADEPHEPCDKQCDKDLKYKELIDNIVKEDSQLFVHSHRGKVIPSVLALEGFAVREFPQSSRGGSLPRTSSETTFRSVSRDLDLRTPERETASNFNFGMGWRADKSSDISGKVVPADHQTGQGQVVFTLGDFRDNVLECNIENGAEFESFKQKCTNWLEHGRPYDANSMKINLDLRQKSGGETNQNSRSKQDQNGEEALNSDDNATGSNEVFVSENEEWAKVTARAIETMQSQVNHVSAARGTETVPNGVDVQCKCKVKSAIENSKSEMAAKGNVRRRNRSGSSLSSFSSVSSDSESALSDIEEMSVCAVCRVDSMDDGTPPEQLVLDDLQMVSNTGFLSACDKKPSQSVEDSKYNPAAISPKVLGSSHDSGYSDTGLNISQENAVVLQNQDPQHFPKPNPLSKYHKSDLAGHAGEFPSVPDSDSHKRFYHVFTEGELASLIEKRVQDLSVLDSFYDHVNWCVIAEKTNT